MPVCTRTLSVWLPEVDDAVWGEVVDRSDSTRGDSSSVVQAWVDRFVAASGVRVNTRVEFASVVEDGPLRTRVIAWAIDMEPLTGRVVTVETAGSDALKQMIATAVMKAGAMVGKPVEAGTALWVSGMGSVPITMLDTAET